MSNRLKTLLVTALVSMTAGHTAVTHADPMGPGGPPRGNPGGFGGLPPRDLSVPGGGMGGRDALPVPGFTRAPEMPPANRDRQPAPPADSAPETVVLVSLSDAVSQVQERFNATAVKTDTVVEGGQVYYRIRMLSADRARVWTVNVDARSGVVF